ncbi:MAG: hypothetical protein DLM55_08170 [Acidimicrobiales bacterium]|nr:MAG: hypothetical protein DLM55_08170 [Acidimicrobiales bacterium]
MVNEVAPLVVLDHPSGKAPEGTVREPRDHPVPVIAAYPWAPASSTTEPYAWPTWEEGKPHALVVVLPPGLTGLDKNWSPKDRAGSLKETAGTLLEDTVKPLMEVMGRESRVPGFEFPVPKLRYVVLAIAQDFAPEARDKRLSGILQQIRRAYGQPGTPLVVVSPRDEGLQYPARFDDVPHTVVFPLGGARTHQS